MGLFSGLNPHQVCVWLLGAALQASCGRQAGCKELLGEFPELQDFGCNMPGLEGTPHPAVQGVLHKHTVTGFLPFFIYSFFQLPPARRHSQPSIICVAFCSRPQFIRHLCQSPSTC